MGQAPNSPPSGQTFLSATPPEMTNEYQNQFREENRKGRFTRFLGVVEGTRSRVLTTYLGDFAGSGKLHATLASYTDMNLTVPAPDPGSALRKLRSASGLWNRGMLLDQIKGLVAPPADLLLNMTILHPGGKWEGIYYANMFISLDCGPAPEPMTATITLQNPNPVQPGVFCFNLSFGIASS